MALKPKKYIMKILRNLYCYPPIERKRFQSLLAITLAFEFW